MKTQAGFTLIELVIVMVIVGLLAAVAAPRFFDFQTTARTNSSANIKGSIHSAMAVAFASHRAGAVSALIIDCATLTPYLDGALPTGTTCVGDALVFPDVAFNGTIVDELPATRASITGP